MKLKRILAAALCLIVVAAILPTAAFAEGARKFTITFQTADEANAGTDSDVWAVLWFDDYGLDTFRSPLLDNKGDDFKRGGTDHYTFDIPDRPIKHVVIEYEDAEWKLDYVEFDGVQYDSMKDEWLMDDDSFMIDVKEGSDTPAANRQFTITFKTANEEGAGTDADVWAIIWYDDAGKDIFKSPELDNSGNDFEQGQLDSYTFMIPNRPVKHVVIEYEDAGWKLDYIEFDGVQYFLPIDKWLDGDGSYKIDVTEETQLPADAAILTFCTGNWDEGGTDDKIELTFYYKDPNSGEIETATRTITTTDNLVLHSHFRADSIDDVVLRGLPEGKELVSVKIDNKVNGLTGGWDLEWVRINKGDIIQCHHTFSYEDHELMVFPETQLVEKTLNVYVGEKGTAYKTYAKINFADGTETAYHRVSDGGLDAYTQYYKDLKVPNKPVKSITVKTENGSSYDGWYLGYMNFDNNHFSAEYPFTKQKYEETFYPLGSEPSDAGSVFGDANMGIIIGVGAAVIVIAAAAVIVGVRKKKKSAQEEAE